MFHDEMVSWWWTTSLGLVMWLSYPLKSLLMLTVPLAKLGKPAFEYSTWVVAQGKNDFFMLIWG